MAKPKARMTREEWLDNALAILADQGYSELNIEALAKKLNVTTGSFYWHFKNRKEFIRALAEHWVEVSTKSVIDQFEGFNGTGEERLLKLMNILDGEDYSGYDLPIRGWATIEPGVADVVRRMDSMRLEAVTQCFQEMGFGGRELEIRAHTFAVYYSLRGGFLHGYSKERPVPNMKERHAFYCQKS